MSSTTANRLQSATKRFSSKKAAPPVVPENTAPNPGPGRKYDLEQVINASSNASSNTGRQMQIEVQPDIRFPLVAILYNVSRNFQDYVIKGYPQMSAPAYVAYCLYLVYIFLFVNDLFVRNAPSPWAQALSNDYNMQQFLESVANLHVPTFMLDIFKALASHSDERRPGLEFIASLAGFSLNHDFGRTIPPYVFIAAHNLLVSLPGNTPPVTAVEAWYRLPVINNAAGVTYRIGQLLGCLYDDNTNHETRQHTSWFTRRCDMFMNMVTSRYNANRPTLSNIPIFVIDWDTMDANPYSGFIGLGRSSTGPENFGPLKSFLAEGSEFTKNQVGSTSVLADMIDTTGNLITVHTLFGLMLPTWHNLDLGDSRPSTNTQQGNITTSTPYPLVPVTARVFARDTSYLAARNNAGRTSHNLPYPDDASTIEPTLYLVKKSNANAPDTKVDFDSTQHLTPPHLIFDPHDTIPSRNYYAMISGVLIQSAEIDGIGIPVPSSTNVSLHDENSRFTSGAIPLSKIRREMIDSITGVYPRTPQLYRYEACAVFLRRMSAIRLPRFNRAVYGNVVNPNNHGFNITEGISDVDHSYSVFTRSAQSQPNISDNRIVLWSSYRIVEVEKTPTWSNTGATRSTDTIVSMLPTLRHLYGLNVTIREAPFVANIVP